jgi:hypothetical protein
MFKSLFIFLLSIFFTSYAYAAKWESVGSDEGAEYYIFDKLETLSIVCRRGGLAKR